MPPPTKTGWLCFETCRYNPNNSAPRPCKIFLAAFLCLVVSWIVFFQSYKRTYGQFPLVCDPCNLHRARPCWGCFGGCRPLRTGATPGNGLSRCINDLIFVERRVKIYLLLSTWMLPAIRDVADEMLVLMSFSRRTNTAARRVGLRNSYNDRRSVAIDRRINLFRPTSTKISLFHWQLVEDIKKIIRTS